MGEARESAGKTLQRVVPAPLFALAVILALAPLAVVLVRVSEELDRGIFPGAARAARESSNITAEITSLEEREASVAVIGRTAPGAMVFLLLDGETVGSGSADDEGTFRFETEAPEKAAAFSVAAVAPQWMANASFAPRPAPPVPPPTSIRSGSTRYVESFTRGSEARTEMVLSLDAGSSRVGAEETLAVLRREGIRTTIFLTGEFIERNPDLVRQILAEGHEVGNHMWSHPHLTTFERNRRHQTLPHVTRELVQSELARTEQAFRKVAGRPMDPYWRAPFGEENNEIRAWASELGYLHVGWTRGRRYNLDTLDWVADRKSPIYFEASELARRMVAFGEANRTTLNGGIVLMHLGSDREEQDRLDRALPELISGLRGRGIRFVTVSELRRAPETADVAVAMPAR
ncbi:MAG: polysaccharide deacetylase family protein [Thermoanaerobaculia bacterium]